MNAATPTKISKSLASLIDCFGQGLDRNDCTSEAWIAYMEAEKSYRRYAGCCSWEAYLTFRVQEKLDALRQKRSHHIQIHSPFSLDQPMGEDEEPALYRFPAYQGSFENSVLFWDYVGQLEPPIREIARDLAHGDSREDIMAELGLDHAQYDFWRDVLRQELESGYLQ